jgi:uncharacterized protein YbjT (DUF2867 family)
MSKTAVILGATGLVGGMIAEELILTDKYTEIRLFVRKKTQFNNSKIKEYLVDFSGTSYFEHFIGANDLFSCLGSTIKKSGSVENMEKIDRDLVVETAKAAFERGVKNFAVISSIGADENSKNYYLRIKGEMEKMVLEIPFEKHAVVRPSLLFGEREEFRFGEIMGKSLARPLGFLLTGNYKKYRGIDASKVAKAMIYILNNEFEQKIFLSDQLHELGIKNI